jgi:hypothetical protein
MNDGETHAPSASGNCNSDWGIAFPSVGGHVDFPEERIGNRMGLLWMDLKGEALLGLAKNQEPTLCFYN